MKKPLTDLATLQKEKTLVEQYIHELRNIQREQIEKRPDKRDQQQQAKKMEQVISNFENTTREDNIANIVRDRVHRLSVASTREAARQEILAAHAGRTLNIII